MGEVEIPGEALWGAQTQRAVENFPVSDLRMPRPFIRALGLIKASAAAVNSELDLLDEDTANAIVNAGEEVAAGLHENQFPIDVFQTGSGTSSNMNANEVIAHLAGRQIGRSVHPNNHVNLGQSSNDTIPTAIHVSTMLEVEESLDPALRHLEKTIRDKAKQLKDVVKTGRTHLMDAMPIRFDQELGAWATQIRLGRDRIAAVRERLCCLAQGGTAVGSGINAHPEFAARFAERLAWRTSIPFRPSDDQFESLGSQDSVVEFSGQLRVVAVSLMKIANDLRWMNSGPLAGLGEIELPALQPGSSIMPGKVNPVIPESTAMVAAHVIGNDAALTVAGQSGNFQLNVMLPMIAFTVLQSTQLLTNVSRLLADKAIEGFDVKEERLQNALRRNPILVTALNPIIGYDLGAKIAKSAYQSNDAVIDAAEEHTNLSRVELERYLDPIRLTRGGLPSEGTEDV
jgi:fumarate hydratase class II